MSAPPYLRFFTREYFAKTRMLNCLQHGAYLQLLFSSFENGGYLPDNDDELATTVCLTSEEWVKIRQSVLLRFFKQCRYGWYHPRIIEELERVNGTSTKRRAAGRVGGLAKASRDAAPNRTNGGNGAVDAGTENANLLDEKEDQPSKCQEFAMANSTYTDNRYKIKEESLKNTPLTPLQVAPDLPPVAPEGAAAANAACVDDHEYLACEAAFMASKLQSQEAAVHGVGSPTVEAPPPQGELLPTAEPEPPKRVQRTKRSWTAIDEEFRLFWAEVPKCRQTGEDACLREFGRIVSSGLATGRELREKMAAQTQVWTDEGAGAGVIIRPRRWLRDGWWKRDPVSSETAKLSPDGFKRFWDTRDRQRQNGKALAEQYFNRVVLSGLATEDLLISQHEEYRRWCDRNNQPPEFTKLPCTWLSKKGWTDDYSVDYTTKPNSGRINGSAALIQSWIDDGSLAEAAAILDADQKQRDARSRCGTLDRVR